jgi:hypothetical protein
LPTLDALYTVESLLFGQGMVVTKTCIANVPGISNTVFRLIEQKSKRIEIIHQHYLIVGNIRNLG